METLDAAEVRVLGSLLEKDLATPEYYPMSLNAVVLACNQKNNRNPVVSYGEDTVERALESLRRKRLVAVITGAGMRVPKYRHLIGEELNLGRRELAVLTVLLLRGPQTIGELRDRTERMHAFTDAGEVESVLEHLMGRGDQPLVIRLPRAPGTKEPRYAHLLAGEPAATAPAAVAPEPASRVDRLTALEAEVGRLREEIDDLKRQFANFRAQFE
ncbi:MAG: YceH family protein [bacterium]